MARQSDLKLHRDKLMFDDREKYIKHVVSLNWLFYKNNQYIFLCIMGFYCMVSL